MAAKIFFFPGYFFQMNGRSSHSSTQRALPQSRLHLTASIAT
jgi:hypothetical protein